VKFLDVIGFEQACAAHYVHPRRDPKLGGDRMVLGILLLLFLGFQRLGQFAYVRDDPMVCGVLRVAALPAVSTFGRVPALALDRAVGRAAGHGLGPLRVPADAGDGEPRYDGEHGVRGDCGGAQGPPPPSTGASRGSARCSAASRRRGSTSAARSGGARR